MHRTYLGYREGGRRSAFHPVAVPVLGYREGDRRFAFHPIVIPVLRDYQSGQ
jgi:hypothetical protein